MTRECFAGGNTPFGFYSCYNNILPERENGYLYCIKGGPGTGKSGLMKSFAKALSERGLDTVLFHCSGDPHSLDAVLAPALSVAILDGTAPHVVDPDIPAAGGEVINLGAYWDGEEISEHKHEIIECSDQIGECYRRAYCHLRAARALYDDICAMTKLTTNPAAVPILLASIIKNELADLPYSLRMGKCKKLFASAITPLGVVNYLDSLLDGNKLYVINSGWGSGSEEFLSRLAHDLTARGLDIETYYCSINPVGRMEHIIVPSLSLAFTTSNIYHKAPKSMSFVDFDEFSDSAAEIKNKDKKLEALELFDVILKNAVNSIQEAKALHDVLESYYIPNINFKGIDLELEKLTEHVFSGSNQ